jgi:Aspartyl/Asparaginyl beta-hydroxylase
LDRFLLLPISFDIPKLLQDLALCENLLWTNHYNQADYSGAWKGISLRSASGQADNILATESSSYHNTALLQQCTYFKEIVSGFQCDLETVRLLALAPGSRIHTHRDSGLSYSLGCFRLHIPLLTDEEVSFVVDGEKLTMQAGECWYANFDLPHSVSHEGKTRRVHLVIDGKRNEWTDELFRKAGYDFAAENQPKQYDAKTKALMIEQLKILGTETAIRLAEELQQQT